MSAKLSVLMITKNAGHLISRSLDSVRGLASEIIVVDGGSTDKTITIAKKHRAKVYKYNGENWGEQCQMALQKTTKNWVLVLDSDEVVTKRLREEITKLLKRKSIRENGFNIAFQSHYIGRMLNHGGEDYKKMVLFKRQFGFARPTLVHFYFEIKKGSVGELKNKIFHYSYLSIPQIYAKFTDYGIRMAKEKYRSGERSSFQKIFMYPPHLFWARFIEDKGYMDGFFRIPLDLGFAYMEFVTYVVLFIMSFPRRRESR